jgi:chromosome segregation protein
VFQEESEDDQSTGEVENAAESDESAEPAEPQAEQPAEQAETEVPESAEPAEIPEAAEQSAAEIDWDAVAELIAALKKKLDTLGPVNLDAIEEFDEVQDRDRFYTNQHDDLTKSREQLLTVIHKLNKTSELMFAETFAKVKKNFQEMFKILFGGGQADLELLDSDDPLESGIDITAKPPGKRPTSVSLLSGGERTMTAVALLFAIYMVKPSPFCILDEMDAPLDESNIDRFLKILDRFVNQSQFIVITHNKRTISRADVLYGVTMQERGVSRLVGVRLSDAQEAEQDQQIDKAIEGTADPDEQLALS